MAILQKTYFLLLLSVCCVKGFSQDSLTVKLNRTFFIAKDSIHISATLSGKKNNATLFLLAEHEQGMVWEMRWPMLNVHCNASLIFPDSLPQGQYRLHFSVLQNLFTVFGKVKTPSGISQLNSTLITAAGDLFETEVEVGSDSMFTYKNVLFQNDAILLFTLQERQQKDNLNIEISTVLDSVLVPKQEKIQDIYIGEKEPEQGLQLFESRYNDSVKAQVLEAVTVFSKPANRGGIFDKKYVSSLFRTMNERIISLLDEPYLNNAIGPLQLIRNQVPGITISEGARPYAVWRGERVVFYRDEMKTDINDISSIPLSDIAIIKAFPPPFFGNMGGSGAAIAVYSKRGGLSDENYRNAFKVKGYTPQVSEFPPDPGRY